jgi:nucleoside-diphosphate-sugar epimerase
MQADATRERMKPLVFMLPYTDHYLETFSKIFTPNKASQYTYVFNCGGETRYSQEDSVYALRSVALTQALARECARRRIPAYVELSTGMVYKPPSTSTISSGGCTETAQLKPWLKLAKHKLTAEEELEKIRKEFSSKGTGELRYATLRLAHVYGEYDTGWLARALCLARVYQSKGEEMKWLYGRELRVNTVHILDAVTAAWQAATWAANVQDNDPELDVSRGGRVFNIADSGNTSQADMASVIGEIFSITTGFQNTLISTFARFNLDSVVDDVNEDVLQPWADLLAEKGITRAGPIGPFMEKELLKDSDLCLNSERAKRVLSWKVGEGRGKMNAKLVGDVVESYKRMNWWP